jgi:hypothetical protein
MDLEEICCEYVEFIELALTVPMVTFCEYGVEIYGSTKSENFLTSYGVHRYKLFKEDPVLWSKAQTSTVYCRSDARPYATNPGRLTFVIA